MNPKNLTQLDPKLREAYERVMGTSAPTQAQTSTTLITPPNSAPVVSTPTPEPQSQVVASKKREGISPILIAIAVILFFTVYSIIWIKVFNLKVPFLP